MKKYSIQIASIILKSHELKKEKLKKGFVFKNTKKENIETLFDFDYLIDAVAFINKQKSTFIIHAHNIQKIIIIQEFRILDNESNTTIRYSNMLTTKTKCYAFYDNNASEKYLGMYSFSALKMFFMPVKEDKIKWRKWIAINNMNDLTHFLKFIYDENNIPYHWNKKEKETII